MHYLKYGSLDNNKISKIQSHKMQTAVTNERAKTKYVFIQRENKSAAESTRGSE